MLKAQMRSENQCCIFSQISRVVQAVCWQRLMKMKIRFGCKTPTMETVQKTKGGEK